MTRRDAQCEQTQLAAFDICDELSDDDIAALISFFKLLDSWDRERERDAKVM